MPQLHPSAPLRTPPPSTGFVPQAIPNMMQPGQVYPPQQYPPSVPWYPRSQTVTPKTPCGSEVPVYRLNTAAALPTLAQQGEPALNQGPVVGPLPEAESKSTLRLIPASLRIRREHRQPTRPRSSQLSAKRKIVVQPAPPTAIDPKAALDEFMKDIGEHL